MLLDKSNAKNLAMIIGNILDKGNKLIGRNYVYNNNDI